MGFERCLKGVALHRGFGGFTFDLFGWRCGAVQVACGRIWRVLWAFCWFGVEMDGGGAFVGLWGTFERFLTNDFEVDEIEGVAAVMPFILWLFVLFLCLYSSK